MTVKIIHLLVSAAVDQYRCCQTMNNRPTSYHQRVSKYGLQENWHVEETVIWLSSMIQGLTHCQWGRADNLRDMLVLEKISSYMKTNVSQQLSDFISDFFHFTPNLEIWGANRLKCYHNGNAGILLACIVRLIMQFRLRPTDMELFLGLFSWSISEYVSVDSSEMH